MRFIKSCLSAWYQPKITRTVFRSTCIYQPHGTFAKQLLRRLNFYSLNVQNTVILFKRKCPKICLFSFSFCLTYKSLAQQICSYYHFTFQNWLQNFTVLWFPSTFKLVNISQSTSICFNNSSSIIYFNRIIWKFCIVKIIENEESRGNKL